MGKIWFFVLIFLSASFGRENPFVPTGELNTSVTTTNSVEILAPFEKQNIKFPSDARNFISISVKYKSEDGSIKEKVIDVNKSINWHDELTLTKTLSPAVVLKPDVSVTMNEPVVDVSVKTAPKPMGADINLTGQDTMKQEPMQEVVIKPAPAEEKKQEPLKKISFHKADFEFGPMSLKILTKDIKTRDFAVLKDKKIVIDFKNPKGFLTKTFKLDCGAFESITFGAHDGFYRASITLDKRYKYTITSDEEGYVLTLKR
ncbi:AMIN domain-containing protein [Campylobacter sp. CCUG 57310]|uniref:AMIN domain-containing protein n=1 Tax=Campylobacter sp. CCUG 57310 TaxID=2517362 RepID=UPI001563D46F|nr:AMIN domain-containing protein [Campylobacter sp. CCUG 57310]QKF91366.1 AMIN domain-containing protein [Campylobacter sp. CCUG 57310]